MPRRKAPTKSKRDWDRLKTLIIRLYREESKTLSHVRQILSEQHQFIVTDRQLKSQINKWKLDKKVKTREMKFIVTKIRRRRLQQLSHQKKQDLQFRVRGEPVPISKVTRWMGRNDLGFVEEAEIPTTPSDVSYGTISDEKPSLTRSTYDLRDSSHRSGTTTTTPISRSEGGARGEDGPAIDLMVEELDGMSLDLDSGSPESGLDHGEAQIRDQQETLNDGKHNSSQPESLYHLGKRLILQGRLKTARDVYLRMLRVSLSPDPVISQAFESLRCLEMTFTIAGYPAEAPANLKLQEMERKCITITNNAAKRYLQEGRIANAQRLGEELLGVCKQRYGPEDHVTMFSLDTLASVHRASGSWKEAEELSSAVHRWCMQKHSSESPNTLIAKRDLAQAYVLSGKLKEAEELLSSAIKTSRASRGQEDSITLSIGQQLALVNLMRGNTAIGEEMAGQMLQIQIRKPDCDVLMTMDSMAIHARGLALLGKWTEAHAVYAEFMRLATHVGHVRRPETIMHSLYWGDAYLRQGCLDEAEGLIVPSLETSREVCGKMHPTTGKGMEYLARLRWAQGRGSEAIMEMELCLEMRTTVLRPGHPDTATTSWILQDMKTRHIGFC